MTLLGVRKNEAVNQETQFLVGMAEDSSWTEGSLTWQNKPAVITDEANLVVSETFHTGDTIHNDPNLISIPEGTVGNSRYHGVCAGGQRGGTDKSDSGGECG